MRPRSILLFERVYGAVIALGVVNTLLSWRRVTDQIAMLDPTMAEFAPAMIVTGTATSLLVNLLLLYFIARRGSVIAKWIMAVLTVGGILAALPAFAVVASPLVALIQVAQLGLAGFAVVLLFRADAQPWFRRGA